MRFMSRLLIVLTLVASLMVIGCGEAKKPVAPAKAVEKSQTELAKEAGVKLIKYDDVKKIVGNGVWDKSRGTLVDARPAKVYEKSHIPTAVLLSDTAIPQYYPEFEKLGLAKSDYIVTYCGGLKCEKSLIVAKYLREKGYTNVEMYLDGQPDWDSKNYSEISMTTAKAAFDKANAVFIDARPEKVFAKGTIPGSLNFPDTKFEQMKGNLPADKAATYITFCGGFKCEKSHFVAEEMFKMGYKKVVTYAGGLPEWQPAGYPVAPGGEVAVKKEAAAVTTGGLPIGDEPGIIKTEYFVSTLIDPAKKPADVTVIDVRNDSETKDGMFPGAINVSSKEVKAGCGAFLSKLPKTGFVVFHCASGGRAMETFDFVKACPGVDGSRFYFLDGYVNCAGGKCSVK